MRVPISDKALKIISTGGGNKFTEAMLRGGGKFKHDGKVCVVRPIFGPGSQKIDIEKIKAKKPGLLEKLLKKIFS